MCLREADGRYTGAECNRLAADCLRAPFRKRNCHEYAEEREIQIRHVIMRIEPAIWSSLPRMVPDDPPALDRSPDDDPRYRPVQRHPRGLSFL